MAKRTAIKKHLKKCGGVLIPNIRKYKRRPCERCKRHVAGEPALVSELAWNPQVEQYTCELWL